MKRRRGVAEPVGLAVVGSCMIHVFAMTMLVSSTAGAKRLPPTYTVRLIAAPAADLEARKAPEAFERPAEEKPAPLPAAKSPRSTVSRATPPPTRDQTKR